MMTSCNFNPTWFNIARLCTLGVWYLVWRTSHRADWWIGSITTFSVIVLSLSARWMSDFVGLMYEEWVAYTIATSSITILTVSVM